MVAGPPLVHPGSLLSAWVVGTVVVHVRVTGNHYAPVSQVRDEGGRGCPSQMTPEPRAGPQGSCRRLTPLLRCPHVLCRPCVFLACPDVCPASSRQAEFSPPLNPFLYPTDQLRGPPVLPEQSVSLEELQGQLAQATRLHQEETEKFTNKIRKVNM